MAKFTIIRQKQGMLCFEPENRMYLIGALYVFNCTFLFRVTANLPTFVVELKSYSKNINS